MRLTLISLLISGYLFGQDTIYTSLNKVYTGKITLDNGLYLFITNGKGREETVQKTGITSYSWNGKRVTVNNHKGFDWDVIIDSVGGDKSYNYSNTQVFISEYWKSLKSVIEYGDKEAGIIIIKPLKVVEMNYRATQYRWAFKYKVTFMLKDYKCRIVISDVYCESARWGYSEIPLMPVSDDYPGYESARIEKERYDEVMREVKYDMTLIADAYIYEMKKKKKLSDW